MVMQKNGSECIEHKHNIICYIHDSRDYSQGRSKKLFQ